MAISQARPKRKISGSVYKDYRKKKQHELGSSPAFTKIEGKKIHAKRVMGGHFKRSALEMNTANIYDPKAKKYSQVKIKTITENPANRNFVRRNIINKGAVIETEQGRARVTSRPGQDGFINAVLIQQ